MKKVLLCIMDGVGISDNKEYNAFYNAKTPNIDKLFKEYPSSLLEASGELVGLPNGEKGNCKVGHINIGAGRIVYQPLEYINSKIKDKTFFSNEELLSSMNHVRDNNSSLHLIGLLSDAGVHSHINHLFSLLEMAKYNNINNVYIHIFTDGRDTSPISGIKYIKSLKEEIKRIGIGEIATISGRYYGMDRNNRWDRIERVYKVMTEESTPRDVIDVWNVCQNNDITDEFITPTRISSNGVIKDGDSLIFFNYREDCIRELINSFTDDNFNGFDRIKLNNIKVVSMMPVEDTFNSSYAFCLPKIDNTLGDYISSKGLTQLRIAETEKYAHVKFFFDGEENKELDGEKKIMIPSPKVSTYDLIPEMSAREITSSLIEEINTNHEDLVILNYANCDMLGHTGNYEATIKGVETLDECIGKIFDNIDLDEYTFILTADHGNCEVMRSNGRINTSHTTNRVPFIVTDKNISLIDGKLGDIAPTILKIMNLDIPREMTGDVLIK